MYESNDRYAILVLSEAVFTTWLIWEELILVIFDSIHRMH